MFQRIPRLAKPGDSHVNSDNISDVLLRITKLLAVFEVRLISTAFLCQFNPPAPSETPSGIGPKARRTKNTLGHRLYREKTPSGRGQTSEFDDSVL